ncbi:hypothetical protein [Silvanigrella aquatica]|uniref:Uncharacterized protein n=1 Tax=Silvanigrella aquatica TaxID=1915309 RepID=A0A1L4CZZ8_9BACT|nr:hypothetical protein [Silvanigrella aquatica]APJ03532.1 hypothetical protein AXG55_06280 [Silvanigrella aquatica]
MKISLNILAVLSISTISYTSPIYANYTPIQQEIINKLPPHVSVNKGWQTSYNDYVEQRSPAIPWLGIPEKVIYSDYHSKQDYIYISNTSFVSSITSDSICPDDRCGRVVVTFSCQRNYKDYGGSKNLNTWAPKTQEDQIEHFPDGNITFYYEVTNGGFNPQILNIIKAPMTIPSGAIIPGPVGVGQNECVESILNQRILPLDGKPI